MKEMIILKDDANQRLDKYLLKTFPNLSQSMMYKAIRNKKIKVNRKRAQFNQLLKEKDSVLLFLPEDVCETKERKINPKLPLNIVYEDSNYIFVNKEYGLLSQSNQKNGDCVVSRIQTYLYEKGEYNFNQSSSFAPSICNRLDRNTTGLIIGAKNANALRQMNEAISSHKVHKYYRAWVSGILEKDGEISLYLRKENTRAIISMNKKEGYKEAKLKYKVLEHKENETKVEIELFTGRFHQIRASFSSIGHPLVADTKYGYKGKKKKMQLQSYKLTFDFDLPVIEIKE